MDYLLAFFMAVIGLLFGGYTYQKNKRKDAEADNLLNNMKVDDARLQQQKDDVNKAISKESPTAPELTPDQVESFWNKKDNK